VKRPGRPSTLHQPWNSSHCTCTWAFGKRERLFTWSKCMCDTRTVSMSAGVTPTLPSTVSGGS
jgi:hypothetical protein